MRHLLKHKRDKKLLAVVFVLLVCAFFVYYSYFDILIPSVADDSYRAAVGGVFVIPVLVLLLGQAGVGGFFLQIFAFAVNKKHADYLKATVISSFLTLWFALTYFWFPKYGPFYYLVFVYGEAPWYALPLEIAWTAGALLAGTLLAIRMLRLPWRKAFIGVGLAYMFMTLAAS